MRPLWTTLGFGIALINLHIPAAIGDESATAPSEVAPIPGPHGGKVMQHRGRHVEVKASPTEKMLHAYVKRSEGNPPKNMSVTLFRDGKASRTLKLKAMQPTQDGFYHYQSAPMTDASELAPTEGSSVGFGIQFGFE